MKIAEKLYTQPWLNNACREAFERKHAAVGTPDFLAARDVCTSVARDTHNAYVSKVQDNLKKLVASSRGWWKLSWIFLTKATGREDIALLRLGEG